NPGTWRIFPDMSFPGYLPLSPPSYAEMLLFALECLFLVFAALCTEWILMAV
ncbi:Unknown protein, partial [Striga hermonthica]